MTTEHSVVPVPMDRSIPPVMMTKVVPSARIPMTAVESRIVVTLLTVRKLGLAMKKTTTSTRRVPAASACCRLWPSHDVRSLRLAGPAGSSRLVDARSC